MSGWTPEIVAYWVLVPLSALSLGAVGVAAVLDWKMRSSWHSIKVWRAVMKLGYMVIVGTILWIVLPRQLVQVTPGFWPYMAGLFLGAVGGIGVTGKTIHVYVDTTVPQEDKDEREH